MNTYLLHPSCDNKALKSMVIFLFSTLLFAANEKKKEIIDFMEIIEDRHGQKATIIISQLPVANWYDVMKGITTAGC